MTYQTLEPFVYRKQILDPNKIIIGSIEIPNPVPLKVLWSYTQSGYFNVGEILYWSNGSGTIEKKIKQSLTRQYDYVLSNVVSGETIGPDVVVSKSFNITRTAGSDSFQIGESITGETSGSGIVLAFNNNIITISNWDGIEFVGTITGTNSSATATTYTIGTIESIVSSGNLSEIYFVSVPYFKEGSKVYFEFNEGNINSYGINFKQYGRNGFFALDASSLESRIYDYIVVNP